MYYIFESDNNMASFVKADYVSDKNKEKGILLPILPTKEEVEGKIAILKCKKSTNEVWWDYEDIQEAEKPKNEIDSLKQENILLQQSLSEVTMLLASQQEQIQLQNQSISELTILFAGGNL